ncbi:MAG: ABC transporter substrate-binding protein [Neptuniibacter sp.]
MKIAASFITLLFSLFWVPSLLAAPYKVLVVMSYEEDFHWSKSIKVGIESALLTHADLTFFYMDTKVNRSGGPEKAKEAFEVYKAIQPDGVITIDDNAQSMFVLPYLKGKVSTPIMFAGVNAEPSVYGFPNKHISGVLERGHIRESIAFLKQLMPDVNSVGFLVKDSASGKAVISQVALEKEAYPALSCGIKYVKNDVDVDTASAELEKLCDAVYIDGAAGINKSGGGTFTYTELFSRVDKQFSGPIIGANRHHVESGAFSAVIKTGYEQGETSARMLLKAMQGTPLAELPITRNYRGRRVLSALALKKFNISPRPVLLKGVELIRGL